MRRLFGLTALWGALASSFVGPAAAENPCTNGSFEELAANGMPVDWSPVGSVVELVSDAHSGQRAVRLVRSSDTGTVETGLNRAQSPGDSGGAMIVRRRGGIEFWYKALSAEDARLSVFAIAMTAEGVERTGQPRAAFTVPADHIGDGQWHRGRLKYDFSSNSKTRWVQFAARIQGTAGELLLDSFSYLEQTGPLLRVRSVQLEEDPQAPGAGCVVQARIENEGDAAASDVEVMLEAPQAVTAEPQQTLPLESLAPSRMVRLTWKLKGPRTEPGTLRVRAQAGEVQAQAALPLEASLQIRSFGPQQPVAAVDKPVVIECVLENTGGITLRNPRCDFTLAGQSNRQTVTELAPGQSAVLAATFRPVDQTPSADVSVTAGADNFSGPLSATSHLVLGSAMDVPSVGGGLTASSDERCAVLANRFVRLVFRRNAFGFGPGELSVIQGDVWKTVAWLPRLSRLVSQDQAGQRVERDVFAEDLAEVSGSDPKRLQFRWQQQDSDGAAWQASVSFELAGWSKEIKTHYELSCDRAAKLLVFEGPMLYVLQRDEAVFPGLEWLVANEVSSSALDIAAGHPDRIRYVVHPNMVTIPAVGFCGPSGAAGMFWDLHQRWDETRDRPSVVFASPQRFENQRAHLVGLFVPSVPEFVDQDQREAARPYPLKAGGSVQLKATLFADVAADGPLAAIDRWFETYGLPEPRPLPRGSYQREIEFSMQAYLTSLWDSQAQQWWTTKGNAAMSELGRPRDFVTDLLLGALITEDAQLRRRCLARAEEVRALLGGEARLDAQRFPNRADLAYANPDAIGRLLAARGEDGAWRFDADQQPAEGPFVGLDYAQLGSHGALEIGLCARKAYEVLRYARISGDQEAYQQMLVTLALMESHRVPRAAQVWEVPVHTPDLLAAADAADAFLEAYRISGQARWLQDAVLWARRGLPFIYLWDDPDRPYLQGASIPVFGATWYQGSWFGRPVQWNGLRYAVSLLKLAEYDQSYPWREIAERVIRSAIQQQESAGEDVALWPDAISAIDGEKSAWVFAPHQIIQAVLKLTGRDPEPATLIIGQPAQPIHVTAVGKIRGAAHRGTTLSAEIEYPPGEQGIVLISNVSRPSEVYLNGSALRERIDVEQWSEAGWRYDAGNAYLAVRVNRDGISKVRADGVIYRRVRRLPWPATDIAFAFDNSLDGWLPSHDISEILPRDGALFGRISGTDPYLVRRRLRVDGDAVPAIKLRMRVTAGAGGQLYWTTEQSPEFDEDKSLSFPVIPDGRFHEYRLELRQHPQWTGQMITQLRLDPCNGARDGEFNVDDLRTELPTP